MRASGATYKKYTSHAATEAAYKHARAAGTICTLWMVMDCYIFTDFYFTDFYFLLAMQLLPAQYLQSYHVIYSPVMHIAHTLQDIIFSV